MPNLTSKDIAELKEALRQDHGADVSDEYAWEAGLNLLHFVDFVLSAAERLPPTDDDDLITPPV